MQFPDIHIIIYFIFVFIPGFIFIKVYSLFMPTARIDFSKSWQEVVIYSSVFTGLTYLLYIIPKPEYFIWVNYLILLLGLFILPAITPSLILKFQKTKWFHDNMILPQPTAWDYIFGKRGIYRVLVHLKDGRKIGGNYSYESYTSSYPDERDIYIEQLWEVDDNGSFIQPIERSEGMWITGEEILEIEFISTATDENGDDEIDKQS